MAERRMFAKTIIDSDAFLDMPVTARLLYYDLAMRADDDGFVNSPKKIMRIIGASDDDLRILCAKKFIIPFENGVVVIKHWKIHNYIRKDTYKETSYKTEKSFLELDENNAYRLPENSENTALLQDRRRAVDEPLTQDRLGKDRIDKDSINISNSKELDCQKPQADFRHAIELWNSLEDLGIKPVSRIDPSAKRFEMLRARIRQYGMKEYENAINRIRGSDFLQGKHSGRPWQITFDWFVKPNNFPKVLEGNYDNAAHIYGDILDNIS